jgi:hypothetical protein
VEQRGPRSCQECRSSISILLRAESDDPWSSDVHTLDFYVLHPNPDYTGSPVETISPTGSSDSLADASRGTAARSPYLFPPEHVASFPSARGHLRCTDIRLGAHGTAVWIQPRPARNLDLTALDVHSSDTQGNGIHPLTGARIVRKESLTAVLLPGFLKACFGGHRGTNGVRTLWDSGGTWTSLDYDEARGMVALGESNGLVTVLRLQ